MKKTSIYTKIFKFLIFAICIFLLYFPIFIITLQSFNQSSSGVTFTGFTLKWYQGIFTDRTLFTAIKNTLLVSVLATLISTVCGTLIAVGIHSLKLKTRRIVLLLNSVPIINAEIVTAISLMIIFSLLHLKFGMTTMLLGHVFFCTPFVIINVMPRLKALDKDLYFAARDLGASKFQTLIKVIIPAVSGGILAGMLIAFTMSIDDFIISWFNTGNGFSNFSIWLYTRLGRKSFSPSAYAYNTLITVITLIGVVLYYKINEKINKKKREVV